MPVTLETVEADDSDDSNDNVDTSSIVYSWDVIALHNTAEDCWVAVHDQGASDLTEGDLLLLCRFASARFVPVSV
eukprot:8523208-Pyramimonas_sp.AAC.1